MSQFKAVIIDDRYKSHDLEKEEFKKAGASVTEITEVNPSDSVILEACRDADAVVVNLAPLGAELIAAFEKCRVISRYGVGYDSIDVAAASAKGISVVNVPDYCAEEVSDQAVALFLACVRQIRFRDASIRRGEWDSAAAGPIHRIAGRTFGLVGYGHIPRVVHRKIKGFDLGEVLVFDPFVDAEEIKAAGARKVDFDALLAEADYISIHALSQREDPAPVRQGGHRQDETDGSADQYLPGRTGGRQCPGQGPLRRRACLGRSRRSRTGAGRIRLPLAGS